MKSYKEQQFHRYGTVAIIGTRWHKNRFYFFLKGCCDDLSIQRAASCVPATAIDLQLDIKIDPKLKKNRSEQVLTKSSKLAPKSIQNGGSEASFWSVGGSILELFWKSGRDLVPKCVLESVVGGSWAFLSAKVAPT